MCVCVFFIEARDLGVGYYAFSQEEDQRKKQRETLDMLRDQVRETRSRNTREPLSSRFSASLLGTFNRYPFSSKSGRH